MVVFAALASAVLAAAATAVVTLDQLLISTCAMALMRHRRRVRQHHPRLAEVRAARRGHGHRGQAAVGRRRNPLAHATDADAAGSSPAIGSNGMCWSCLSHH